MKFGKGRLDSLVRIKLEEFQHSEADILVIDPVSYHSVYAFDQIRNIFRIVPK